MREEFEAFKRHMGKLFMKLSGSVLAGWPERPLTPNEGGTGADFAAFFHPAPEVPPPVVQEPHPAVGAASDAGQGPPPPPEWLAVRELPPAASWRAERRHEGGSAPRGGLHRARVLRRLLTDRRSSEARRSPSCWTARDGVRKRKNSVVEEETLNSF